ncbi:MAG: non-canonical purine NTP pyrophosphatase [Candidatus Saccharibacteria bacterium]
MTRLAFATSNTLKFLIADEVCRPYGIELVRVPIDLLEIQADNGEAIARHKAAAAFEALHQPLVISDDSTSIPGLGGFPGPYMKYMNEWLTPADFLHLTETLEDRRLILRQVVVYQDATQQRVFTADINCLLLKEIRGESKYSHLTLTSVDGTHSLAQGIAAGGQPVFDDARGAWHEFSEWFDQQEIAQSAPLVRVSQS